MAEPTVRIPVRTALIAARGLNQLAQLYAGHAWYDRILGETKQELIDAIVDGASQEDIDVACVAIRMQEATG